MNEFTARCIHNKINSLDFCLYDFSTTSPSFLFLLRYSMLNIDVGNCKQVTYVCDNFFSCFVAIKKVTLSIKHEMEMGKVMYFPRACTRMMSCRKCPPFLIALELSNQT